MEVFQIPDHECVAFPLELMGLIHLELGSLKGEKKRFLGSDVYTGNTNTLLSTQVSTEGLGAACLTFHCFLQTDCVITAATTNMILSIPEGLLNATLPSSLKNLLYFSEIGNNTMCHISCLGKEYRRSQRFGREWAGGLKTSQCITTRSQLHLSIWRGIYIALITQYLLKLFMETTRKK